MNEQAPQRAIVMIAKIDAAAQEGEE